MHIAKKNLIALLILVFVLGAAISAGGMLLLVKGLPGGPVKISADEYKYYRQLDSRYAKLNQLYERVENEFYQKPDEEMLATGMYKGLLAGLDDPYSGYMTAEEYEYWEEDTVGEFDGIGVTFTLDDNDEYVVVSTQKGSPAAAAGLRKGDVLLAVDGKTYDNMQTFSAAMRGKAGTEVDVTYSRGGREKTVTIERATIVNETVESDMLEDNLGYIKISAFEEHTDDDFLDALEEMEKKPVDGLIIDLRGNGGGLVDVGAEIADALLGKGTIVYLEDQQGERQYLRSDKEKTALPYVLLVDEHTASTSEIIAAAVKDNTDNPLVGVRTYGKGIVQSTEKLKDGSAVTITFMQYFSPKGNVIHNKGIKPDYVVKDSKDDEDRQLDKAMELLR